MLVLYESNESSNGARVRQPQIPYFDLVEVLGRPESGDRGRPDPFLLVITVAIPQFRRWENIVNITRNFSFVGFMAVDMTRVILVLVQT